MVKGKGGRPANGVKDAFQLFTAQYRAKYPKLPQKTLLKICAEEYKIVRFRHENNYEPIDDKTISKRREDESEEDKELRTRIEACISTPPAASWDEIKGLDSQKDQIFEAAIFPLLRPELFVGRRKPARALLLFGPPGTGKTLIARSLASTIPNCRFFNISSSCLTSKWAGESEKLVKLLFETARMNSPSLVFIDEIDGLTKRRNSTDDEASRRLKTEILTQMDGAMSDSTLNMLLVGATNCPNDLDDALKRRFTKCIYIPLPEANVSAIKY